MDTFDFIQTIQPTHAQIKYLQGIKISRGIFSACQNTFIDERLQHTFVRGYHWTPKGEKWLRVWAGSFAMKIII